jgi:hypothetical protein
LSVTQEIESGDADLIVYYDMLSTLDEVLEEISRKWKKTTKTHNVKIVIVTTIVTQ